MIPDLKLIEYYVNEVYNDGIKLTSKCRKPLIVEKKAIFVKVASIYYHHAQITQYCKISRSDQNHYNSPRYKTNYDKRFIRNLEFITSKIQVFEQEDYYLSMGTL